MSNVNQNLGQVRISSMSQQIVANHLISFMGTFYKSASMAELKKKPGGGQTAQCEFT